jgi:hypothetical protein
MTVDSAIALVDRAIDGELSMRRSVCCRSACDVAATWRSTSLDPVIAYASRTSGIAARSSRTQSSAPWVISSVTNASTMSRPVGPDALARLERRWKD